MKFLPQRLRETFSESLKAVSPIVGLVLLLSFTIAPLTPDILLCFIAGSAMLVIGMMFFNLGAQTAMTPMGERLGTSITKSRRIWSVVILTFILGFIITVSEPDLQVLARQVPSVPDKTLILAVAVGVGVFLVAAILRTLLGVPLRAMLIVLYTAAFALVFFVPEGFRAVAFDSGGVTTGPMTVPFIMALGIGSAAVRNDSRAADDSFGLVALSSIGPIISVLLLGMVFTPGESDYSAAILPQIDDSTQLAGAFLSEIPHYLKEIAMSLLPITLFFAVFQIFSLKLSGRNLGRIAVGLFYTYVGLVIFLTGANVGFMPAGVYLGRVTASLDFAPIIVPIGALIGFFIVRAEPAVGVLTKQVEELTDGAVSAGAMGIALSVGVSLSVALSMVRVLLQIPIIWFLLPGYALALILSFFVPKLFTAIAFDSGGVASGPMTAAFLLPFAQGACLALGGDVERDAFGAVAMVAMTPLITIQVLGLFYKLKQRGAKDSAAQREFDKLSDNAIIEL